MSDIRRLMSGKNQSIGECVMHLLCGIGMDVASERIDIPSCLRIVVEVGADEDDAIISVSLEEDQ